MATAPLPKRAASARRRAEARGAGESLRVLIVGTDDWAIEQAAAAVELAGHQVMRCHEPGEQPFPCNAFRAGRGCPIDTGVNVIVTSRARPTDQPAATETGVVCGLHAGRPLIVSGISRNSPYGELADLVVGEGGDLIDAIEQVASQTVTVPSPAVPERPAVVALPEAVER